MTSYPSRIAALRKALEDIHDGALVVPRAKQALRVDDKAADEMDAALTAFLCACEDDDDDPAY